MRLTTAQEDDGSPIAAAIPLDNLSYDGHPRQTTDAHNGVARRIVSTVHLGPTQLPDTHRSQANSPTTCKAEQQCVDDDPGLGLSRGKPDGKRGHHDDNDGDDEGVVPPDLVRIVARDPPPEDRAHVENDEHLGREGIREALLDGIRADVRQRDEQSPLHQEQAQRRHQEDTAPENPKVGVRIAVLGGRQPGGDEQVRDGAGDEEDERDDPRAPRKTNLRDAAF
ncbi:hypothetical protein BP6252_05734 [Coleophoma cylindrospora]|uniref:Uncharacterized protein n=1 Tax=Coleophoma cylindrospora TaxID=1849047 RepID=A0A3D8RV48_9HELO|nr:hypothetical protein BP6252_05734 [Coleophoma cylindrospora]